MLHAAKLVVSNASETIITRFSPEREHCTAENWTHTLNLIDYFPGIRGFAQLAS